MNSEVTNDRYRQTAKFPAITVITGAAKSSVWTLWRVAGWAVILQAGPDPLLQPGSGEYIHLHKGEFAWNCAIPGPSF
ncbi:hypothetical protein SBDP1_1340004 [Syntrophobacter sp. SbD1]|nr:hypothetical protein SBDP1_1340004 [Syntrophobacter sp. SbD1]